MNKLAEYGFILNEEKLEFYKSEINFLGYVISKNKIKLDLDRTQGIQDFPVPKTVKEVRRFIGMIGYERRFLHKISDTLKPLYELTKKDARFRWTEEHQLAFEKAKSDLIHSVNLTIPDRNERFILETDASATGMGAILRQKEGSIVFFSASFSPVQQKYSITERELYAAMWGMEKCRNYLYGREFDLITDHKAIETYFSKENFGNARIQRWYDRISEFNFVPKYRPGEELASVDALSRSVVETPFNLLLISNDDLEKKVIEFHRSSGHRKSILNDLKKKNINISQECLTEILNKCNSCLEMDDKYIKSNRYVDTTYPGEILGVDLMYFQNNYIIVAVDYFSRKVFTKSLKFKNPAKILDFLSNLYDEFKFKKLITDCGKEFKNSKLSQWTKDNLIIHHFRPAYYSKGSGRVERAIRTLRNALNKVKGMLKTKLGNVTKSYNSSIHRAIKMCPEEALIKENWDLVLKNIEQYKKEFVYKEIPKLSINDEVLIRNEVRVSKEDKKFSQHGVVIGCLQRDTYLIKTDKGLEIIRHFSQLKKRPACCSF